MEQDRAFGWDDQIEKDGSGWEPLPAGDYDFVVVDMERGNYNGGTKIPACPRAIVTIRIQHEGVARDIKSSLFLHSKVEGILSSFFGSIGQKKHGEPLRMDWSRVVGSKGRAKLTPRKYTGADGREYNSDNVSQWLYQEDVKKTQAPAQQGFTPGMF